MICGANINQLAQWLNDYCARVLAEGELCRVARMEKVNPAVCATQLSGTTGY